MVVHVIFFRPLRSKDCLQSIFSVCRVMCIDMIKGLSCSYICVPIPSKVVVVLL